MQVGIASNQMHMYTLQTDVRRKTTLDVEIANNIESPRCREKAKDRHRETDEIGLWAMQKL